jgi:GntR family transcriptional regulator
MEVSGVAVRGARRPLDRSSPLPLWAQLQQELTRRLASGGFDAGFPGELDLVEEYDVSRHTVREALRRLRDAGLIGSSRGRGTWVQRTAIEQPLGSLYSLFREVESRGMLQRSDVLRQELVVSEPIAALLGLPAGEKLFFLERVRFADDEPLAHDQVWLPAVLAGGLVRSDFRHAALYDELAARCGIALAGGEERISAIVPAPRERELLSIPRGIACFAIERSGQLRGTTVEHRRTVVRADRFSVVARWTPSGLTLGSATGHTGASPANGGARQRQRGARPARQA